MLNADSESMFLNDLFGDGLDTDAMLDNAAGIGHSDPATTGGLNDFDMPDSPPENLAWHGDENSSFAEQTAASSQAAAQARQVSAAAQATGGGATAGGRAAKPPSSRSGGGRRRASQTAQAGGANGQGKGAGKGEESGANSAGAFVGDAAEQARLAAMQAGQVGSLTPASCATVVCVCAHACPCVRGGRLRLPALSIIFLASI